MKITCVSTLSWIYSLADYRLMFDLSEKELTKRILDFPGGISSFNAEMHALDHQVISADRIYNLQQAEMLDLGEQLFVQSEEQLRSNIDALENPKSLEDVIVNWDSSKTTFLMDYTLGREQGRYQEACLPKLPFKDDQFQLALCSDFLFHLQAREGFDAKLLIAELCRVSTEARIFPLMNEAGQIAEKLGPIMLLLQQNNFGIEVRQVKYPYRKGSNAMLRIWQRECIV